MRVLVIHEPRPGYVRDVTAALFIAIVGAFFLLASARIVFPEDDALFSYLVFALLLLYTIAFFEPLRKVYLSFAVRRVYARLVARDDAFFIPNSVSAEVGVFSAWRYPSGAGGWKFFPRGNVGAVNAIFRPESHLIAVSSDGVGRILLPGFRLSNGVLLLYMVPVYAVEIFKTHLSVSLREERADLFMDPTGTGFSGYLRYAFTRASSASVSLVWDEFGISLELARAPGRESFVYPFIHEPLVIVTHESFLSPATLYSAIGFPLIQGEGSFRIVLSMKIPMEGDIYDFTTVSIVPRTVGWLS